MYTTLKNIWKQKPVVSAMGKAVIQSFQDNSSKAAEVPGKLIKETIEAPDAQLIKEFLKFVGGDLKRYEKTIPPYMFCQWMIPTCVKVLESCPFSFIKVINGGCTLRINEEIPLRHHLKISGQLTSIQETGKFAVIEVTMASGTSRNPNAIEMVLSLLVPSNKPKSGNSTPRLSNTVPEKSLAIDEKKLTAQAGWKFATLTGDFNPIHWLSPYAKVSGFKSSILHGYGSFALSMAGLERYFNNHGYPALKEASVRFTSPFVLPGQCNLYLDETYEKTADGNSSDKPSAVQSLEGQFFLGRDKGERAFLVGNYLLDGDHHE